MDEPGFSASGPFGGFGPEFYRAYEQVSPLPEGTPPPEVDPLDIVTVDQDYKCTVCGAELTMKAINPAEDKPPKHCREEMIPVWRP